MLHLISNLLALMASKNNAITDFTLIDADLDTEIGCMPSVIDYAKLPTTHLNVRANYHSCSKHPINSVFMDYKGPGSSRQFCERWTPYAVFGDNNPGGPDLGPIGPFDNFTFPIGSNQTIVASPDSGAKCNGTKGIEGIVNFDVVNTATCPGKVLSFVFWDADAMTPLFEIKDQMRICSNVTNYNIEARVTPCAGGTIGSVKFAFGDSQNTMNVSQIEKRDHYFLYGDFKGVVFGSGAPLPKGFQFTLSATPYSAKGGNGKAGEGKSISFKSSSRRL